ncbi:hypothetical protein PPYR_14985, partial [Photinus pyralis]
MNPARRRIFAMVFDDSDSEDEFLVRRPRWIREREDHIHTLDDLDFITRYHVSKQTTLNVLQQIEDHLEYETDKNFSISPINQLLCALRFYATGSFQVTVGDLGGFSQPTAHRIIHKVSNAIALLRPRHAFFPETDDQLLKTQTTFYRKARFPKVVGAIDCTHVRLAKSPGGDNAKMYRNRKGYFSLNVQAICNANLEFMDIVARWPGSTHDSYIFNNCSRRAMFEQGRYGDAVLVGDSGYACNRYMMTPLDNCYTAAENLYNESQIRTRNPIERLFGVWKRRFPVTAVGLRVSVPNCFAIIVATIVLHNIAVGAGEQVPHDDDELHLPAPWDVLLAQGQMGNDPQVQAAPRRENPNHRWRRAIIDNYFT